jgi:hypothetical protein
MQRAVELSEEETEQKRVGLLLYEARVLNSPDAISPAFSGACGGVKLGRLDLLRFSPLCPQPLDAESRSVEDGSSRLKVSGH